MGAIKVSNQSPLCCLESSLGECSALSVVDFTQRARFPSSECYILARRAECAFRASLFKDTLHVSASLVSAPNPPICISGARQSQFGTRHWCTSGTEMLFLGGCCAGLAFEIGKGVDMLLDQNHG